MCSWQHCVNHNLPNNQMLWGCWHLIWDSLNLEGPQPQLMTLTFIKSRMLCVQYYKRVFQRYAKKLHVILLLIVFYTFYRNKIKRLKSRKWKNHEPLLSFIKIYAIFEWINFPRNILFAGLFPIFIQIRKFWAIKYLPREIMWLESYK